MAVPEVDVVLNKIPVVLLAWELITTPPIPVALKLIAPVPTVLVIPAGAVDAVSKIIPLLVEVVVALRVIPVPVVAPLDKVRISVVPVVDKVMGPVEEVIVLVPVLVMVRAEAPEVVKVVAVVAPKEVVLLEDKVVKAPVDGVEAPIEVPLMVPPVIVAELVVKEVTLVAPA